MGVSDGQKSIALMLAIADQMDGFPAALSRLPNSMPTLDHKGPWKTSNGELSLTHVTSVPVCGVL